MGTILFPIYFHFWRWTVHPHWLFEILAYVIAFCVYLILRQRFGDPVALPVRWTVVACATAGAVLGSKLLYWLEDPRVTIHHLHDPAYLLGGKTIVGALIGGLIAVETIKKQIGEHRSTGDLFAIPLALGIAIGRIGCFLTGLSDNTYGTITSLPWGVDFGDGVRRHPTQLYEILFFLVLMPFLYTIMRGNIGRHSLPSDSRFRPGDIFRFFMVTYMSFRILCDFIKPYSRVALGLGTIQWAGVLVLLYYANDILGWFNWSATSRPSTEAS